MNKISYALVLFCLFAFSQATLCFAQGAQPAGAAAKTGSENVIADPTSPNHPFDANEKEEAKQVQGKKAPSLAGQVLKTVLWLVFVILLIAGMAFGFRKLMPASAGLTSHSVMEVLCKQYIDPKQKLVAVKILNKVVILGVSPQNISTVMEITDPAEVTIFEDTFSLQKPEGGRGMFGSFLKRETHKFENQQANNNHVDDVEGESFDDKIKNIRQSIREQRDA